MRVESRAQVSASLQERHNLELSLLLSNCESRPALTRALCDICSTGDELLERLKAAIRGSPVCRGPSTAAASADWRTLGDQELHDTFLILSRSVDQWCETKDVLLPIIDFSALCKASLHVDLTSFPRCLAQCLVELSLLLLGLWRCHGGGGGGSSPVLHNYRMAHRERHQASPTVSKSCNKSPPSVTGEARLHAGVCMLSVLTPTWRQGAIHNTHGLRDDA